MSRTLYPYPVLFGRPELEITRVRVDGRQLDFAKISHSQRSVALDGIGGTDDEKWQTATLDVRATLPEEEIADGPWSELHCVAVLEEAATETRIVRRLIKDRASGTWQGSVPLHRSRHRSRATLGVQVVAAVGDVRGRLIGRSENDWVLDLQEQLPVRDKEIDIVEVDFRDGPHVWLRPFKDAPWFIETDGDMPTVYLNQGVDGLGLLLRGNGGPAEKATAALVNAQIVSDAWVTMFHAAAGDLETDEDGNVRVPPGWRESVLLAMLPDVLPGLSPTDALHELLARREDGDGWSTLQARVQYAASLRAQLPKQLAATLRATTLASEGATR